MWDVVIFDLDGTLTDPKEGITRSVAHALSHMGIHVDEPDSLVNFIGPPLVENFRACYGMSQEQALEALAAYRSRFSSVGWAENLPYSGIRECLETLRSAGKILLVATSKPEVFARRILEHFGLAEYFDRICGISLEVHDQTKADMIRAALNGQRVSDLRRVIMVGDRKHDIIGAHEVGIQAVGVLYGYGSREELVSNSADHIVENIAQLTKLLLT